jgi:hypothetical protein
MSDEKQREGEATPHAFWFAMKEADPEGFKRAAQMKADEIKGQMLGGAILQSYDAYQERKRQQQMEFFDLIERNRAKKQ